MADAQPVGQGFAGETIRVQVVDAVFDNKMLIAAWTVENLTDDYLYLLLEEGEGSIRWNEGEGGMSGDREIIAPGKTINGLMERRIYDEVDGMIETGLFARAETVEIAFDLAVTEEIVRSLLPGGEPVEMDMGGFTMRVTRADVSPSMVDVRVLAIFPDEATALRYTLPEKPAGEDEWWLQILMYDEAGCNDWSTGYGWGMQEAAHALDDGRWAAEFFCSHSEITQALPTRLLIAPRRTTSDPQGRMPWVLDALEGVDGAAGIWLETGLE